MNSLISQQTPREQNYSFPPEWARHRSTWLSYPHAGSYSWPGTLPRIFPSYHQFIKEIAKGERVCINVRNANLREKVIKELNSSGVDLSRIDLFVHPTNDAWCRDHGPAFLINPRSIHPKIIVSWNYNAWGNKYPYNLDEKIPGLIGKALDIPVLLSGYRYGRRCRGI